MHPSYIRPLSYFLLLLYSLLLSPEVLTLGWIMGLLAISDTKSNFIGQSKIQLVEILSPKSDCPEI